jgi:hypothetical protein
MSLSQECVFAALSDACEWISRLFVHHQRANEQRRLHLERQLAEEPGKIRGFETTNARLEDKVVRLSSAFASLRNEGNQGPLYSRDCGYLFGTNDYMKRGELVSRALGLCL